MKLGLVNPPSLIEYLLCAYPRETFIALVLDSFQQPHYLSRALGVPSTLDANELLTKFLLSGQALSLRTIKSRLFLSVQEKPGV